MKTRGEKAGSATVSQQGRPVATVKNPAFVGPSDWRGARVTPAELPSLSNFVQRSGELIPLNLQGVWTPERLRTELDALLSSLTGDDAYKLNIALRRLRRRVLLSLVVRDTTGRAGLEEVVSTMTALAELSIQTSLQAHARELAMLHGIPLGSDQVPQDLLVVGMGKLGGGELNVSSDIDLIFVYDDDGDTAGGIAARRITNHEFFARLGRRVIAALNDLTADGFVFRVDMRLRPNGVSGPLALSTAMLEQYLMAQGREWERFAWLKSRIVSAPVFASPEQFAAQCAALADIVRPFVFRKYFDFGAIASLRELHKIIRAEASRRHAGREDRADDVKLGRGGIRELEFVVQTFQIIRGGRDTRLRSKSTLQTLTTLASLGMLPQVTCERLSTGYEFLRNLEHALQYVDDAQTHRVPTDPAALERVARLMGAKSAAALMSEYRAVQKLVAETFDATFSDPATEAADHDPTVDVHGSSDASALITDLQDRGFTDPQATAQRVRSVLESRRAQTATDAARAGLRRLLHKALQTVIEHARTLGAAHDIGPDEHFARFAQLADVIAGRSTYISLLNQFPQAFERVMRMLAASRWATTYLIRHPILLDELLDERLFEREPDWHAWSVELKQRLGEAHDDQEQQMNLLRDAHHAQVFRLLVADLDGRLTVERLADHLSALADATLTLVLELVWQTLPRRPRAAPQFAIIGYGKLGGKELGYESDLDLIFLYDDDDVAADEIYGTLGRRLITWLSTPMPAGILFEIDLRLRPDGSDGLIVASFDGFSRYQRNERSEGDGDRRYGAWPWEHQALTRARFCAGDAAVGARFEAEREHILMLPRSGAQLAKDVLDMRARMHAGHPNPTQLFDVKHDRGGMVDVEFIVQYLVLLYAHKYRELLRNAGNIALLETAGALGLIDRKLAHGVADAYRTYRRIQHRLRLNGAERARLPLLEVENEVASVKRLWNSVFIQAAAAR